jgi:hypothetical protein
MPRLAPFAAALCFLCLACDSGDKPKESGGDEKKAEAKPKPKPFEGDLTVALIEGMSGDAKPKPFDAWDDALALVESKLGKVTKVDGKDHSWAIVDGDKCAYFTIEKDGDKVGIVDGPGKIDKMMKSMFDKCVVKSGAEVEVPADDPDAPLPPEDGASVKPTVLMAGVKGAPSKWVGQEVTVEGVYFSTSTATATGSDETNITVSIRDDKDTEGSIGCSLAKGGEAPKLTQYDPIKAKGKVSDTFGGGLDECQIVP